jgi:hypothetical protein
VYLIAKVLVKYSIFIFLLQFLTCYEIPVDYSRAAYPQVIFTSSLDTTFYNTNIDSALHAFDTCKVRYSKMRTKIIHNFDLKYTFGYAHFYDSIYPPYNYFNLSVNDTFHVRIDSIPAQRTYEPYLNSSMIQQISRDSIKQPDGSYSLHYAFKPLYRSKGYIFFGPKDPIYFGGYDSDTVGDFILCYCVDTPKEVRVKIDTIKWSYLLSINDTDTTWLFNKLVLKGKTSAFSLKIRIKDEDSYSEIQDSSDILDDPVKEYSIFRYPISPKDSLLNITIKHCADSYILLLEAFNGLDKKLLINPPRNTTSYLNDF